MKLIGSLNEPKISYTIAQSSRLLLLNVSFYCYYEYVKRIFVPTRIAFTKYLFISLRSLINNGTTDKELNIKYKEL